jgi:hypothetical protein
MSSETANAVTLRSGIVHALAWNSPRRYKTYRQNEMPYTRCGKQQWHGLSLTDKQVTCKGCLRVLEFERRKGAA